MTWAAYNKLGADTLSHKLSIYSSNLVASSMTRWLILSHTYFGCITSFPSIHFYAPWELEWLRKNLSPGLQIFLRHMLAPTRVNVCSTAIVGRTSNSLIVHFVPEDGQKYVYTLIYGQFLTAKPDDERVRMNLSGHQVWDYLYLMWWVFKIIHCRGVSQQSFEWVNMVWGCQSISPQPLQGLLSGPSTKWPWWEEWPGSHSCWTPHLPTPEINAEPIEVADWWHWSLPYMEETGGSPHWNRLYSGYEIAFPVLVPCQNCNLWTSGMLQSSSWHYVNIAPHQGPHFIAEEVHNGSYQWSSLVFQYLSPRSSWPSKMVEQLTED